MADEKPSKPKAMTKSMFYSKIAEATDMKKADVVKVFEAMTELLTKELGSKGPRVAMIPGLFRLKSKRVEKVKGGQKKINPLTKTEYITKDKPAYTKVTVRPLKQLKEAIK
jgi:nucleoid DNA-binding protein